jgi:hypothetical protein
MKKPQVFKFLTIIFLLGVVFLFTKKTFVLADCNGTGYNCSNVGGCTQNSDGSGCHQEQSCRTAAVNCGGSATQPCNCTQYLSCSCPVPTNPPSSGGGGGGNTDTGTGGGGTTGTTTDTTTTTTDTATAVTTVTKLSATEGTEALCGSLTASANALDSGGSLTLTATAAAGTDIKNFTYNFFNKDTGKAIIFIKGENFIKKDILSVLSNTNTQIVTFTEMDKSDLNWVYYANKPKNIIVEAYFTLATSKWSKFSPACRVEFKVNSVDLTPTPNVNCKCTSNICTSSCLTDYFSDVTYTKPPKCGIITSIYQSTPTVDDQLNWCKYYLRVKGDANGDGIINTMDYFYFTAVKTAGAKIPASINVDFNGDGNIGIDDRAVIVKTISTQ